jgi:hypothetical protein
MVYLRVPPRHVRDFSTFSVRPSKQALPSARCANVVGKFLDIFTVRAVSLHSMQQLVLNNKHRSLTWFLLLLEQ